MLFIISKVLHHMYTVGLDVLNYILSLNSIKGKKIICSFLVLDLLVRLLLVNLLRWKLSKLYLVAY